MPNHFLLTGNELVADWPHPDDIPTIQHVRHTDYYEIRLKEYTNRPRYTCTKELLAMLKEGGRYEEGKDFETHPCSCDRRMDNHTDCGKPGKNRTPQCFIAVPVEKGEGLKLKLIPADNKAVIRGSAYNELIHEVNRLRLENASLKQQLSKH